MIEKSYGSYGDDTRYAIKNEFTVYNEMKTWEQKEKGASYFSKIQHFRF